MNKGLDPISEEIEAIKESVTGFQWKRRSTSDRNTRRQLRLLLLKADLPLEGELFEEAYAYLSSNYLIPGEPHVSG